MLINIDRLINRPPQHAINDTAEWVAPMDPAWDNDRIEAERLAMIDAELAKLPEETPEVAREQARLKAAASAGTHHPVGRWMTGATAYSWEAPLTVPEVLRTDERPASTVTIGDYLKGEPMRFEIKPLGAREWRRTNAMEREVINVERIRFGLVRFRLGDKIVEPERDRDGAIAYGWIDALDQAGDPLLLDMLGNAIFFLSDLVRRGDAEGKR